jgi:lipopolysaccharide heptosyltransferase II
MSSYEKRWADAHNILCIRLDTLGDVIMTGPAIRALKELGQGPRITLLTSRIGSEPARLMPDIDQVISYDAPWMNTWHQNDGAADDHSLIDRLRNEHFDAAVIFTVYSQNPLPAAFLCYLSGIPLRLAHCRENPYHLLTDWVKESEPAERVRHEVERQLDLVGTIGAWPSERRLFLSVPTESFVFIDQLLGQLAFQGKDWVVIHPGARALSRRYPEERFASVADGIVEESGYHIIFTGTLEEQELILRIQERMDHPSYSLAGDLSLGCFAALLSRAPLLISNNTGAVHVAAAVGTPVVDLYALTNPQHTPWMVPQRVLFQDVPCKYCYKSICPEGHHNCLRLVSAEQVLLATRALLAEIAATGPTNNVYPGH